MPQNNKQRAMNTLKNICRLSKQMLQNIYVHMYILVYGQILSDNSDFIIYLYKWDQWNLTGSMELDSLHYNVTSIKQNKIHKYKKKPRQIIITL